MAKLLEDLRHLIEETRQGVALAVNAAVTMLYWHIGKRYRDVSELDITIPEEAL